MGEAAQVKLIVGLGNPGREYHGTRHNVGFEVIDLLSKTHRIPVKARRNHAVVGEGTIAGEQVVLARPQTFMNRSGEAVAGLARRYRIPPEEIIVVYDDSNLPMGKLRIRTRGSAGGHNGMKSIIHSLGSQEFPRIRLGIGSPNRRDMIEHVLSRFTRAEMPSVRDAIERAADAVEMFLEEGPEPAMNRFNADPDNE